MSLCTTVFTTHFPQSYFYAILFGQHSILISAESECLKASVYFFSQLQDTYSYWLKLAPFTCFYLKLGSFRGLNLYFLHCTTGESSSSGSSFFIHCGNFFDLSLPAPLVAHHLPSSRPTMKQLSTEHAHSFSIQGIFFHIRVLEFPSFGTEGPLGGLYL